MSLHRRADAVAADASMPTSVDGAAAVLADLALTADSPFAVLAVAAASAAEAWIRGCGLELLELRMLQQVVAQLVGRFAQLARASGQRPPMNCSIYWIPPPHPLPE